MKKGRLILYARINTLLPESFSLGLRLEGKGVRTSLLVRLNGWHGPHPNPDKSVIPRNTPHIHIPTKQELAGDYAGKVALKAAVELQPMMNAALPNPPAITDVWPFFAEYLKIQSDGRVDDLLAHLSGATPQQLPGMI
ncbi:hypothetical protein HI292_30700 [Corallococcus exiguus]|nr:hypothetical protein [Corallococcus exiguus]